MCCMAFSLTYCSVTGLGAAAFYCLALRHPCNSNSAVSYASIKQNRDAVKGRSLALYGTARVVLSLVQAITVGLMAGSAGLYTFTQPK